MNASRTHDKTQGSAQTITVQVVRREQVTSDTIALWLSAPGTLHAPAPYVPGQFITLAVQSTTGVLYRSYSLSSGGNPARPWEITLKRHQSGAVSTWLHTYAAPGMILQSSLPRGNFVLPARIDPHVPLIFIAAGSGISPIFGMLRALARLPERARPPVQLHYASRNHRDVIYTNELAALDPEHRWLTIWQYISATGTRLTPDVLTARTNAHLSAPEWYICGPEALKRSLQGALVSRGVSPARIHVEVFGDASAGSANWGSSGATGGTIRIASNGATVAARPGESLLVALERNGYHPPFSCRAGACGECQLRVLAGTIVAPPTDLISRDDAEAGMVLGCMARPRGEVVLESPEGRMFTGSAYGQRRAAQRRGLRYFAGVAAALLFLTFWRLTSQVPLAAVSTSSSGSPGSGIFTTSGGDDNGSFGDSGSSSFNSNPGSTVPSTSTGVS